MQKVIDWLKGKKTYIVAILVGVMAALQAAGIEVPEFVYTFLAALGLGTVRAGVDKAKK